MKNLIATCFFVAFLLLSGQAQDSKYKISDSDYSNQKVEMADEMRSNGKIYVVVGVMMLIFCGITFYLYSIDQKVTKLEESICKRDE